MATPIIRTLAEPHAIGARVHATREATRDVFGDAAVDEVLGRLGAPERALFTSASPPAWIPERTYAAWMTALWEGPCNRDAAAFARWVDRVTDRGFGTARRLLMSLASPWVILRRADALWRTEHSHGALTFVPEGDHGGHFELRDHPFAETELGAAAISEAFRHIVLRCRVRWATERHERMADGTLRVLVRWG